MKYNKLGNTDLEISEITFGAWAAGGWMWGGSERNDAVEAMITAYDLGVTSIDTAPIYGQGNSEEIVATAIKNIPRHKLQILTKYGLKWDGDDGQFYFKSKKNNGRDIDIYKCAGKESIIKECEDSLKRLGTDYIDLYQIHWPDPTTPIDETMEAVSRLIDQGKVKYAGVCNYNAAEMKEAESTINIASNQVPYSMVNRGIEDDVIPYCIEHNKGILAYSPLQRGLLTGKMKPGHEFEEGDHRQDLYFFKDENIKRTDAFLQKIKPIAKDKGVTLAQLVIRWTLEQPGITVALVGARNAKQAGQNAKAGNLQLTHEEVKTIDNALDGLELIKDKK
ncbi:MAG: aldo/keto reductase [Cytophagaceae bacterium]|nr:aldo/keto reductase [Cytophagaceae bacterium]